MEKKQCQGAFLPSNKKTATKNFERKVWKLKRYTCIFCKMTCSDLNHLNRHIITHTKERPFSCHISSEKPFDCPECPAAFGRNKSLQRHIKCVHRNVRPFQCNLCSKAFSNRRDQYGHMLIHVNERPYKCEIRATRFRHCTSLNSHKKVHLKGSPYLCSKCLIPFANQGALERHYLKIHVGCDVNILQCFYCILLQWKGV